MIAIFTAYLAGSFSNLMDYIQALASFFNAPLFAIFIFGLFYKKMTGTAGWTGLLSGVTAAVIVDLLVRADVIDVSSQAGSFLGASAAFVVGVHRRLHRVAVHPEQDRRGAGRAHLGDVEPGAARPRERSRPRTPAGTRTRSIMGRAVIILTLVLYIIWW